MPELPEVETVRRGLETLLIGHTVQSVSSDWPKSFPNSKSEVSEFLLGAKVTAIRRRAKVLLIDLDSNYSLMIHLKMTGQLVYVSGKQAANDKSQVTNNNQSVKIQSSKQVSRGNSPDEVLTNDSHSRAGGNPVLENERSDTASSLKFGARNLDFSESEIRFGAGHPTDSLVGSLPDKSTRVMIELDNNAKLFFNDQRKFGWVTLLPTVSILNTDFMKKVGPEPLEDEFRVSDFESRLMRRKNSCIKAVLLDQTIIAGVGNIYADESLWGAKIHPETRVIDIPKSKIKNLYSELRAVLRLAIEKGGSTDKNYVNAEGKKGSYISFARVFRKEGTPCQRCGTEIIKTRVAGRGTHICPRCQK